MPILNAFARATFARHQIKKAAMKTQSSKRPRGRQPIGATLVDGKWVMTEAAAQSAIERVLKVRENARARHRMTRELLLQARPDLFVKQLHPNQTTLVGETLVRSTKQTVDPSQYQKTDTTDYAAFWRSVQRSEDGAPNLSRE